MEPAADDKIHLRLASEHRLSTHFNVYASVRTDGVMRDVQELILGVIIRRCEAGRVRSPNPLLPAPTAPQLLFSRK